MAAKKLINNGWEIQETNVNQLDFARRKWKSLSFELIKHSNRRDEEATSMSQEIKNQEKVIIENVVPGILEWAFTNNIDYGGISKEYFCASCAIEGDIPTTKLYSPISIVGGGSSIAPKSCSKCNSPLSPVGSFISKEEFYDFMKTKRKDRVSHQMSYEREKTSSSTQSILGSDYFLEKLMKLGQLRERNILTEEEFQAEKEKILNSRDE